MTNAEKKANTQQDGIRVLFPTLIYEAWFPDFADAKSGLLTFNHKLREQDTAGRSASSEEYPLGYTSYFTHNNLSTEPALAELVKFLERSAIAYAQQHNWDVVNYMPVMNSLWGNINPRFSYHRDHLHPYSHISGVFYVNIEPGASAISFKDPRMGRWMMPPAADGTRAENTFFAKIKPEDGKLLLFPAWLEHGVEQNLSDTDRVSMSFNFEMRPNPQA